MKRTHKRVIFDTLDEGYYRSNGNLTSSLTDAADFHPRNEVKKFLTTHNIPENRIRVMRRHLSNCFLTRIPKPERRNAQRLTIHQGITMRVPA